ncbi:MAG: hypothetical protein U0X75_18860 [Acidobacteriota bacterium]
MTWSSPQFLRHSHVFGGDTDRQFRRSDSSSPVNQTVCEGGPASFSVTATGTGLSYQWRKNGAPISGATNSSFAIPAAAAADAGSYDVVVTGSCSAVTSSAATLTVPIPAQPSPLRRSIKPSAKVAPPASA